MVLKNKTFDGPRQVKKCLRACAKCAHLHNPAHADDWCLRCPHMPEGTFSFGTVPLIISTYYISAVLRRLDIPGRFSTNLYM